MAQPETSASPNLDGTLRELSDVLARVAPESELAKLIARRAGFPPEHLPEYKTAIGFWSAVVEQAARGKIGLEALVAEAASQYPHNPELAAWSERVAQQAWRMTTIHPRDEPRPRGVDVRVKVGLAGIALVASCTAGWAIYESTHEHEEDEPKDVAVATRAELSSEGGDAPPARIPGGTDSVDGCREGFELKIMVASEKPDGTPWDTDFSAPDVMGTVQVDFGDGSPARTQSLRKRQQHTITAQFFRDTPIPRDARVTVKLYDEDLNYNDSVATFSQLPLERLLEAPQKRGPVRISAKCRVPGGPP